MRIRRSGLLTILAAALLLSSPAVGDEFSRPGTYLAISGVYGFGLFDTDPIALLFSDMPPVPIPLDVGGSWGLNVRAGNRIKSWLAFELEYEWMQGIAIDVASAAPVGGVPTLAIYRPDTVTLNAKFILPLWRAQPYLLVGGGVVVYNIEFPSPAFSTFGRSDSGFAFRGGGGLDFYVTKHIVLNVEGTVLLNTSSLLIANRPAIDNLYYVSVGAGIAYRF